MIYERILTLVICLCNNTFLQYLDGRKWKNRMGREMEGWYLLHLDTRGREENGGKGVGGENFFYVLHKFFQYWKYVEGKHIKFRLMQFANSCFRKTVGGLKLEELPGLDSLQVPGLDASSFILN